MDWRNIVMATKVSSVRGRMYFAFLKAVHAGLVWYDPADSVYADGKPKVRPQWRTGSRLLEQTMAFFYSNVRRIRV